MLTLQEMEQKCHKTCSHKTYIRVGNLAIFSLSSSVTGDVLVNTAQKGPQLIPENRVCPGCEEDEPGLLFGTAVGKQKALVRME